MQKLKQNQFKQHLAHNKALKRDFENTHFFCKERKKTACSRNPLAWRYVRCAKMNNKKQKNNS